MRVGLCVGLLYTPSGGLRPHPRNSGAAPRNSQIFPVGLSGAPGDMEIVDLRIVLWMPELEMLPYRILHVSEEAMQT